MNNVEIAELRAAFKLIDELAAMQTNGSEKAVQDAYLAAREVLWAAIREAAS